MAITLFSTGIPLKEEPRGEKKTDKNFLSNALTEIYKTCDNIKMISF